MTKTRLRFVFGTLSICALAGMAAAQKVVVAYFSQTGHTKAMAEAVVKGASAVPGAEVRLLTIDKTTTEDLAWADALIVGTPVQMTNVAPQVLEAMNRWPMTGLKDKIGAAFVTGGGISSGEEIAQVHLLLSLLMEGMIVVGGPSWDQAFGASAVTMEKPFADEKNRGIVDPKFLAKGEALGKRVAEIAKKWLGGK